MLIILSYMAFLMGVIGSIAGDGLNYRKMNIFSFALLNIDS